MEMITGSEKSAFIGFLANQIQVATQYFQQSRNIMNTNEIILPEERLKKVDDINGFLDEILSTIQKQTQTIKVTNSNRLTKKTLVDFSKDAD
jgi:RNA binding exosome subunit